MNITTFDDLVHAARHQPTSQRLLLVFARAELPEDATPQQRVNFEAGAGGALVPVMCVDKPADTLESFQALAHEAGEMGFEWDMLFAGAIGDAGAGPNPDVAVNEALERMVESVKVGAIGAYIPFDRRGNAVALG